MKEIALLGTTNHVLADVLGKLLADGLSVNAMVDYPERVMLDDTRLTVSPLHVEDHDSVREALEGYSDVVLAYNDDLSDAYTNDLTLKYFVDTTYAARQAGASRLIVVGSPDSEAFFVTELRRLDDIDWVFFSTEGDYAGHVSSEVIRPNFHKEVYTES